MSPRVKPNGLLVAQSLVSVSPLNEVTIQVANLRPVPVNLFKGIKVGTFISRNKVMLVEDRDTVIPVGLPSSSSLYTTG